MKHPLLGKNCSSLFCHFIGHLLFSFREGPIYFLSFSFLKCLQTKVVINSSPSKRCHLVLTKAKSDVGMGLKLTAEQVTSGYTPEDNDSLSPLSP